MRSESFHILKLIKNMMVISTLLAVGMWIARMWMQIPSSICIRPGETEEIHFSIPATGEITCETLSYKGTGKNYQVDLARPVSFFSNDRNTYKLNVKLFGVIPFKQTDVSVVQKTELYPVGKPIGIYVKTDGILVLDTGSFTGIDGIEKAPTDMLVKKGDYILACNGKELLGKKEFIEMIKNCNGDSMLLKIERNDATFEIEVTPQKDDSGEYKLGIWIRDNAQGVGTLTYIDKEKQFGALGHGINDMDISTLMELRNGSILKTNIIDIKKGTSGTPGELTGVIRYAKDTCIGEVEENTNVGIFGEVDDLFFEGQEKESMQIMLKQEVKLGAAQIISTVDGEPCRYNVEITEVHLNSKESNKGIELKVTDTELLQKTGGIVQGMSGSPIIQNGKFVGAVTHVLVNDPKKGYGIFIENMLEH